MNLLILNQLGTPDSPDPQAVGRYLTEFLMDPNIIGAPRPILDFLVKVAIVPRRKFASAKKYKSIWTDQGSPLAINTFALEAQVKALLPQNWRVTTGMRYGNPSLASVLSEIDFNIYENIYFLPLYPQFAQATVGSSIEKMNELFSELKANKKNFKVLQPFYSESWFVHSQAEKIKNYLNQTNHLLLSYHGIPVSQEKRSRISYYKQCLETSRLIAEYLNISPSRVTTSFQSRVGPSKWLAPSTEDCVMKLAKSGQTELVVACPSFVADCLETLEEIGIELKEKFLHAGGNRYSLVPCLNSDLSFAKGIVEYATRTPQFIDIN